MEEQWQEALSGFDAVWQRVQSREALTLPPQPETGGETALLERLLCCMAETEAVYRAASGRETEVLRRMAAQCRQDLQKLRAEYYLRSGEVYMLPAPERRPAESLPALLRLAWHRERALAEALREAELHGLAASCPALAERSRQRRERVFELLCQALH